MNLNRQNLPTNQFDRPIKARWKLWLRVLFFVACIVIIHESLIPAQSASIPTVSDKLVHFGAYFTLVVLAAIAFPKARLTNIVGLMILLGTVLEGAQGVMGLGRSASVGDLLANMIGASAPACLWVVLLWLTTSRHR